MVGGRSNANALWCARAKDEKEKRVKRARRGRQSARDTLAFMESITGPIMMQITMCMQGEVGGQASEQRIRKD